MTTSSPNKIKDLINHVLFIIDESGSMNPQRENVVEVFDQQIKYLSNLSQKMDQETRVTVYKFSNDSECIIYDKDVMRTPSLKGKYKPGGGTALLDATSKAVNELKQTATLYGDHAFLVFVLTDGDEIHSRSVTANDLKKLLAGLATNWSFGVLVPDRHGEEYAVNKCGFNPDSVVVWDVGSAVGLQQAVTKVQAATDNFMRGRAAGVRSTKNLFQMNSNVTVAEVKQNLTELDASKFDTYPVRQESVIKDFVEKFSGQAYRLGSAYYQLTKRETIQGDKDVLLKNVKNGRVYSGDEARQMLGLPNTPVRVTPTKLKDFKIFVKSSSVNRILKLTEEGNPTELIVIR